MLWFHRLLVSVVFLAIMTGIYFAARGGVEAWGLSFTLPVLGLLLMIAALMDRRERFNSERAESRRQVRLQRFQSALSHSGDGLDGAGLPSRGVQPRLPSG
jgi:peptidoglycan/LPS O-acetylase OafA/YrhL